EVRGRGFQVTGLVRRQAVVVGLGSRHAPAHLGAGEPQEPGSALVVRARVDDTLPVANGELWASQLESGAACSDSGLDVPGSRSDGILEALQCRLQFAALVVSDAGTVGVAGGRPDLEALLAERQEVARGS